MIGANNLSKSSKVILSGADKFYMGNKKATKKPIKLCGAIRIETIRKLQDLGYIVILCVS
jgi:hypothetical protein